MNAPAPGLAAVTGIGPVSRGAIGVAELAAAPAITGAAGGQGVLDLDNFDPAAHLGRRGWKFLPPATRAGLAALRLALADAGDAPERTDDRTGVVVGTNFAVHEIVDRIDRALLADGISGISPVECPNFAVNVPVGQLSMSHGLKAFNITLANLVTAGAESLLVGARALAASRADAVFAGAIEGLPPAGFHTVAGGAADASGACLLHLERTATARRRGARIYALLTGGVRRTLPRDPHDAERILGAALDRTGAEPSDNVQLCVPATELGRGAEDWVHAWAAERGVRGAVTVVRGMPQACATSVLALAQTLARGAAEPVEGWRDGGLVSATLGPQGNLVVLRFGPAGEER
ncbi:beta-ketoacyl synthase N-terminal-like domain-containing protein [Streptomyces sp. NPDC048416]|uniref:beta-ketoacyl synthase N-terminal-like domain-containing protein n=1 Tax=Streptomyces sp. NPDC048416 TaxID=3365546 RepID=UPI00371711D5